MIKFMSSARFFLFVFLTIILISQSCNSARAELVDRIVAVVNGEVITQTELNNAGKGHFDKLRESTPAAELEEAISKAKEKILDDYIENLIVSQKAKELGIEVSEEEIDNTISRIIHKNSITEDVFYVELEKTGTNRKEYRRQLTNQILHSKLVSYEVRSRVVINEEKAREYYDMVYSKQKTGEGYHLQQIGLMWGGKSSSSLSKEKARQKTEGIRKMAIEGQDFKELARSFSELPSAKYAGDLGFVDEDEMSESLREIISKLKPGQISPVIEARNAFQFYCLITKNINGITEFSPFEKVKQGIIDHLREEALDTRYKSWMKELKDQAIIKKLI